MRYCHLLVASLLACPGIGLVARAQAAPSRSLTMPDSAQMSALMARAMRRLQPAQFVLDHRAELALTPEQVPFLESLALAQADSMRVRNERRGAAAVAAARNAQSSRAAAAMSWTGPVDEAVLAQFVVDSAGRYEEGSFHVLRSSHDLFTQAVRAALPGMRFIPAELNGAKVRQLVQQPFIFAPGMK